MLFGNNVSPDEIENSVKNIMNKCFDTINLKLEVQRIVPEEHSEESISDKHKYKITKISFPEDNKHSDVLEKVKRINEQLKSEQSTKPWNIFYFYKEFIQQLRKIGFNYFRGQTDNWELKPSIARCNQYDIKLMKNYEGIYKETAEKLEDIEYFPFSEIDSNSNGSDIDVLFAKRNTKLGVLQHYGFPTPLVDITSNPYIAMLFMCDKEDSDAIGKSKRLDLFKIDTMKSSEYNIFSSVFLGNNKRIKAQRGEFLDFSKYDIIQYKKLEKIQHIVLEVDYPTIESQIPPELFDRIIKIILNPKGDFSMIQRSVGENYKNQENLNSIEEAFSSYEKRLEFAFNAMNWKKADAAPISLNHDLSRKLKEFGYTESLIFPDTYNQLQFIKRDFEKSKSL